MNYLDIINKCLVELNYKQVSAFSELIKNDHKKLKNIINIINTEICSSAKWNFLQREISITLLRNTSEIENIVPGRIETVIVDGNKLEFFPDFEKFFTNSQPLGTYSFYDDKILFSEYKQDKQVDILYYSNKYAKDSSGNEKQILENYNDESIIPAVFAEPILVYGSCMRLKGNPQHIRFNYWVSMYNNALANMRSRISATVNEIPSVKMFRQ